VEGETGAYILRGLPEGEVSITATVYGAPFVRSHDTREPQLRIVVPVLGQVRAAVNLFDEAQADKTWLVCLVPEPGSGLVEVYALIEKDGREDSLFKGVQPGRYSALVRRYPDGFADMQRFEDMSPAVSIEVRAREVSRVELWP
jgi:hypothetical protein